MFSAKRLIALGVASLVIGLVATFPARIAYQWFAPDALILSGIAGTVWRGTAAQGSAGDLFMSEVAWRFRPLALMKLKAGFAVSARLPSGFVESEVAIGAGGLVHLGDLVTAVPLSTFEPFLQLQGVQGDVSVQVSRLVLDDGFPAEADGTVGLSDLVLQALGPSSLGDFRAVFHTDNGIISAVIEDVSGVLEVDGNLALREDRTYSFTGQVAASADAPSGLHEQLRFLGSPDAQGRREFRFEGSL